jgi:hypothetical protein
VETIVVTSTARAIARATLACAIVDGLWAVALTAYFGRPPLSVWNGVAATVWGPEMATAGARGVAVGLAMHLTVAFSWSSAFVLLGLRSPRLRQLAGSPGGMLVVAALYGPFIWLTMSGLVIPTLTGRALTITPRWFIQVAGHMVFVGLPIVWGARPRVG